jgi:hypothetical protein
LANAEALAASLIIEQYARSLGNSEVAQLAQFLGQVGAATADSGGDVALDALHAALCATIWSIAPATVRSNLSAYYTSLGASVTVPPFEQFLCGCGIMCAGTCVNEKTDPTNCGTCGTTCPTGGSCQNGACVCPMGQSASNGVCCPTGQTACGGVCVDEQTNASNCGQCGNSCGAGSCLNGSCSCPAPGVVCGGACVDVGTDNNNCGSCGTICSTTAPSTAQCLNGRCLVTRVTGSSTENQSAVALDSANFYWMSSQNGQNYSVLGVPIGGGVPSTIVSGLSYASGLAVRGGSIFWTDDADAGSVGTQPISGGSPVTLASGGTSGGVTALGPIAVNGSNVYWDNGGMEQGTEYIRTSALVTVPLGGGPPTTLASAQGIGMGGLALDAANVYWSYETGTGQAMAYGGVFSMPLGGGTITTLAAQRYCTSGFAIDGASVYWTELYGNLMKVAIGGGTPVTLATNGAFAVVSDGTYVYWSDANNLVLKMPVNGGTTTTLVSGFAAYSLLVDSTSLYFTSPVAVMRLTPK